MSLQRQEAFIIIIISLIHSTVLDDIATVCLSVACAPRARARAALCEEEEEEDRLQFCRLG